MPLTPGAPAGVSVSDMPAGRPLSAGPARIKGLPAPAPEGDDDDHDPGSGEWHEVMR